MLTFPHPLFNRYLEVVKQRFAVEERNSSYDIIESNFKVRIYKRPRLLKFEELCYSSAIQEVTNEILVPPGLRRLLNNEYRRKFKERASSDSKTDQMHFQNIDKGFIHCELQLVKFQPPP